ncbi:MAG: tetraacyldisaccharide 4'-kinase [Elusimicrobiota bacterium]|nr:tetraacyldisaccharide 4'-kinase [Elusimicrobiota bacterium]
MKKTEKILKTPLSLLSGIYGAGTFLHRKFTRQRGVEAAVISVGNITSGGTGKTPLVINIVEHLQELELDNSTAILSRGYGRKSGKYKVIEKIPDIDEAGDEVKFLKEKFPHIPVFLGRNRYKSAAAAVKYGARIIILDDGFQSWELARDKNIGVIDATDPFGGGALIPAGRLREPVSSLKRADSVVINRCGQAGNEKLEKIKEKIYKIRKDLKIFTGVEKLKEFKELWGRRRTGASHFRGKKILALSGIGNPKGFYNLLESAGLNIECKFEYRDHYRWSDKELNEIASFAYREGLKIIATQKDAARFSPGSGINGWEAVMKLEITEKNQWKKYLKENI